MKTVTTITALIFVIHHANGFGLHQSDACRKYMIQSKLHMETDSFPSDSSNEATIQTDDDGGTTVDVEPKEYIPTESETGVTSLLDVLPSGIGQNLSKDTRASINEAILNLESVNPTEDPATSPLLNGVWSLKYAGGYESRGTLQSPTRQLALFLYSGGYSPGLFALSLAQQLPLGLVEPGDLEITIARDQPRVEAKVGVKFFGGADNDIVVKAKLDVGSEKRITETYESATVMGQVVDIPEQLRYNRDLYVTYVDNDILVVRDGSGVPEILVRKEKMFMGNWDD